MTKASNWAAHRIKICPQAENTLKITVKTDDFPESTVTKFFSVDN